MHTRARAGKLALRAVHYLARAELRRAMQFHRVVRRQEGALLHQDAAARVQVDELDVSHLFSAERGVAVVRRSDCLHEEGLAAEDRAEETGEQARIEGRTELHVLGHRHECILQTLCTLTGWLPCNLHVQFGVVAMRACVREI